MTREEAIKSALKFLVRKQQEQGSWGYADNDDTHEVSWNEIIEWVDQRSCGNSISRESALEILDDYAEDIESGNWGTAYSKARTSMCDLPSAEPEQKSRECASCKHSNNRKCAYTEKCHECMWENQYEQRVEPERKPGKWHLLDECANEGWYCDQCHKKVFKADFSNTMRKYKFCPNCGAKMEGGVNCNAED